MNLLPRAQQMLEEAYQRYLKTGKTYGSIQHPEDPKEMSIIVNTTKQLLEGGYFEEALSRRACTDYELSVKGIEYFESPDPESSPNISLTYNIHGGVQNSVLHNQGHANITVGSGMDELQKVIAEIQTPDREILDSILSQLHEMANGKKKMKPGVFSKSLDILNKYPAAITALSAALFEIFTKTNPFA